MDTNLETLFWDPEPPSPYMSAGMTLQGLTFHVDAWQLDDNDPRKFVDPQADAAFRPLRRYRDLDPDEVWDSVRLFGRRFVLVILPVNRDADEPLRTGSGGALAVALDRAAADAAVDSLAWEQDGGIDHLVVRGGLVLGSVRFGAEAWRVASQAPLTFASSEADEWLAFFGAVDHHAVPHVIQNVQMRGHLYVVVLFVADWDETASGWGWSFDDGRWHNPHFTWDDDR
jgi:hypothetical protein